MDTQPQSTPTQSTPTQSTPTQSTPTQPESAEPTNSTFATFEDYTNARLSCTPAEQKTVPGTGPQANPPSAPQNYYQIPLLYDCGVAPAKCLNDALIEFCELKSEFGIQFKTGPSGRPEQSIMVKLNPSEVDDARMISTIDQLHGACAFIVQQMRGAVKLPHFQANMAEATGMKNPIYRPRDAVTNEPLEGRSPSMFLKLFSRGKPPMVEQTLFTGLEGKPIPWTLLQGVEMKFIPLVHVKRIYVGGGKASIQMEVVSAVVTSIRARGSAPRQLATIARLQHERPELADTVASQLAKLTMDRQDQLLGTNFTPAPDSAPDQPTFSGIVPTGTRAPVPISMPGSMPSIAPASTMTDFTAGAPVRVPVPGVNLPQIPMPTAMPIPPSMAPVLPPIPQYDAQSGMSQGHIRLE